MTSVNVGLVGYYGWGNYGDEFFKYVLDSHLQCNFRVLHDLGEGGKLVLDRLDENIDAVDVIMIGGGDLVIPYALSTLYWREEYLRKPVVIYGVGVPRWGGFDQDVVLKMREFFQHPSVQFITARDSESADWIATHLKPSAPVSCEPDIVCAYQHQPVMPRDRTFGIVLRHQTNGLNQASVSLLLKTVAEKGFIPRLLMLATDRTLQDDFITVGKLDLGNIDIVVRDNIVSLTDELLACSRVASMKFHGCVVAMSHNVPCLALSAANKFKNFYAELDRPNWVTSLADAELGRKLEAFISDPPYGFDSAIREQARQGLRLLGKRLADLSVKG